LVHEWPTYNFPHADPETIEPEVVFITICIIPLILVSICAIVQPGWKKHYSSKKRIHRRIVTEFLLGLMAASLAYLLNGVITDVIKIAYGRPRPDFLSRCFTPTAISDNPNVTFTQANGPNLWLTLPSRQFPGGNTETQMEAIRRFGENGTDWKVGDVPFPFIEDVGALIRPENCINNQKKLLMKGGRRSFPSGHTSFSFAGATFCALYSYVWLGKISSQMNLGRTDINFPGVSFKLGMFGLWYIPAIYVAISRTQDYRHLPGDVFAGALIGTTTTLFCFVQYFSLKSPPKRKRRLSDAENGPCSVHDSETL